VKKHGFLLGFPVAVLVLTLFATGPQLVTSGAQAYAKQSHAESKIISDTLAAHKITCLSRNGSITSVLLDGEWLEVKGVELVSRTLIITTEVGTLSLAAAIGNP
jgi:hypothetical protein